jgi:hypothetical protein
MRKLTILLAAAALVAPSTGCIGRCKSFFSKGSPCGTVMTTPAVLSAPMAMGAPFAGPVMQPNMCCEQAPMCVPCDPCMQYDPCANTGMSNGYFGNYMPSDCGCAGGSGGATMVPSNGTSGGIVTPVPMMN